MRSTHEIIITVPNSPAGQDAFAICEQLGVDLLCTHADHGYDLSADEREMFISSANEDEALAFAERARAYLDQRGVRGHRVRVSALGASAD